MTSPTQTVTQTVTDATEPGPESGPSRRRAIAGAGSLCLLGLGLAACSGDSDSAADTGTASSASASSSAGAEGSISGGTKIVALADIEEGGAVSATINGTKAVVTRPKGDVVAAFNATCPHAGGTVAPNGTELKCPLHQSTFDLLTGEALSGPALQTPTHALKEIEVVVDGDDVVTA